MRPLIATRAVIAGGLLIGPAVLGFFSGGYFDRARIWAGIIVWVGAALAAVACPRCWPRTRGAWLAFGGLAALAVWSIVSIAWAPLRDAAQQDAQRTLIYLGVVIAAAAVFRERTAARAVEPALALGALVVVGEGLSERLFPGVFHLSRDLVAGGRLTQPLTYWNAMAIAAAMGFVLCVRIAGDESRAQRLRIAAVAAGPPIALGLYLTLSRGGVLVAAIGLVLVLLLAPAREQLLAVVVMLLGSVPAIIAAATLSGVRSLNGSLASREWQGLVLCAVLAASILISAAVAARYLKGRSDALSWSAPNKAVRRIAAVAGIAVALATVAVFIVAATSKITAVQTPAVSSSRLATTESIRGNFWRVAVRGFVDNPIRGVGAGGFETEWRRHRTVLYSTRDAHSLYLETLCELGLVGAFALLALIAGVATCARRAHRLDPAMSSGWIAVVTMFAVHAGLDWDWEMPAVSLIAFVLVGAIVARAEADSAPAVAPDAAEIATADITPVGAPR